MNKILLENGNEEQLGHQPILFKNAVDKFDAVLFIRAPFNHSEEKNVNPEKRLKRSKYLSSISKKYLVRTATRSLKRTLCEFPTAASAQIAGMSMEDYEKFVYNACHLYSEDSIKSWKKIGIEQQVLVDYLNRCQDMRFKGPRTDVSFSVKDRIWINSDGKTNMPSGEVFTGPVEDTVNGTVFFDYPAIYLGEEVSGVTLTIVNGKVEKWSAERGENVLTEIFKIKGSRYFGEVAIGTNYNITKAIKNILFDEKIGGTIHMALGQSYKQTGGKNESLIHWDLVSDMCKGEIFCDGEKIYENGNFLIL